MLDFKTDIDINDPDRYIRQLHLYYLALEHNPEYSNKDVENLIIYSLGSKNRAKSTEPKQVIKHKLEKQLSDAAKRIRNNQYQKTEDTGQCRRCLLKDLCNIED